MRLPSLSAGCFLFLLCAWFAPAADPVPAATPKASIDFFEKSVRPLLVTHCFECHGQGKQKGGLRLDSRAAMLTGGDSGPAMTDRKSTRLNSSHIQKSRMPSSA